MKKRAIISKRMIVRMIITALILFFLSLNTTTVTPSISDNTKSEPSILDLIPHNPIYITSDLGFAVFPGLGTAEDPHIIEEYNITTNDDYGIYITYTTKHFIIRNCYVNAAEDGIRIYDVADGIATVINNTCSNNGENGISLVSSGSSTVANNTCSNNDDNGISLGFSVSSTVANNMCSNNDDNGIFLYYSDSSTVINNTCSNNNHYGIELWSSAFCVVTYNLLQENEEYGVYVWYGCDNNLIHHNTFVDNNLGGSSQAYDQGRKNKWYDLKAREGNYWSDLGSNCEYKIGDSYDFYPLNRDQSCPNPFTMTILSIILPLLVIIAILAFVVPKYGIPYFRKRIAERSLRITKLLSCPNCGKKIELSVPFCENCETSLPKRQLKLSIRLQLKVLENKTNKIIVIVYLVLFLFSISYLPWLMTNYVEDSLFIAYPICIFGIGFPLTCLTLVILFRAEINKKLIGKSKIESITVRSTNILLSILILSTAIFTVLGFYGIYHFKDSCCCALLVGVILSLTIYIIFMIFFRSRIAKMPIMKKIIIIISSIISLFLYEFFAFFMSIYFCWLF